MIAKRPHGKQALTSWVLLVSYVTHPASEKQTQGIKNDNLVRGNRRNEYKMPEDTMALCPIREAKKSLHPI